MGSTLFALFPLPHYPTAGSIYVHQNALHLLSFSHNGISANKPATESPLSSAPRQRIRASPISTWAKQRTLRKIMLQCLPLPNEFPRDAEDESLRQKPLIKSTCQSNCPSEYKEPCHMVPRRLLFFFHDF